MKSCFQGKFIAGTTFQTYLQGGVVSKISSLAKTHNLICFSQKLTIEGKAPTHMITAISETFGSWKCCVT